MYPYIQFTLPSYSVLAAFGAVMVLIFLFFRTDKFGVQFKDFLAMFVVCAVLGGIGSRVVFILSRIPWLITNLSVENVLKTVLGGGFVYYGGLFGVLLGILIYCRLMKLHSGPVYNMVAPAIPLFHIFGRIGCFLAGCCYGFLLPTPITIGGMVIDRFPAQIVEAGFNLVLFLTMYLLQKKFTKVKWMRIYLISYAAFRFFIEFTRGDELRGFFFGLSTSQLISIFVLIGCVIRFFLKPKAYPTIATDK